jgi:NAD(P)-dependent dehydrogenase (short-subunit alcohol dehydrogenase family)
MISEVVSVSVLGCGTAPKDYTLWAQLCGTVAKLVDGTIPAEKVVSQLLENGDRVMSTTENAGPLGTLIVTGASRGIGAAIARLAGVHGYSVAVNFATDEKSADRVVRSIVEAQRRAVAIQADVSKEADILRLFQKAESQLGPIVGLVNNAAVTGGFSRVESVSAEALARVFTVNVAGAILCAREAVRRMSTRHGGAGGSIVNISSRAAQIGGAGEWVHYAASKGAIDSFTIGLAREVATEGVRVNAVAPGLVKTDLHAANGMPDRPERLAPSIPMQRAGTPEEVAEAVLWMLSSKASYTTGAILEVGGGR